MAPAREDLESIKRHLGAWLSEHSLAKPPLVYEIELRERMVRVEEELSRQRELMREGFAQVEKRFEQIDKRFEQMDRRFAEMLRRHDRQFCGWWGLLPAAPGCCWRLCGICSVAGRATPAKRCWHAAAHLSCGVFAPFPLCPSRHSGESGNDEEGRAIKKPPLVSRGRLSQSSGLVRCWVAGKGNPNYAV